MAGRVCRRIDGLPRADLHRHRPLRREQALLRRRDPCHHGCGHVGLRAAGEVCPLPGDARRTRPRSRPGRRLDARIPRRHHRGHRPHPRAGPIPHRRRGGARAVGVRAREDRRLRARNRCAVRQEDLEKRPAARGREPRARVQAAAVASRTRSDSRAEAPGGDGGHRRRALHRTADRRPEGTDRVGRQGNPLTHTARSRRRHVDRARDRAGQRRLRQPWRPRRHHRQRRQDDHSRDGQPGRRGATGARARRRRGARASDRGAREAPGGTRAARRAS